MFGFLLFVKSFHWLASDRIEWVGYFMAWHLVSRNSLCLDGPAPLSRATLVVPFQNGRSIYYLMVNGLPHVHVCDWTYPYCWCWWHGIVRERGVTLSSPATIQYLPSRISTGYWRRASWTRSSNIFFRRMTYVGLGGAEEKMHPHGRTRACGFFTLSLRQVKCLFFSPLSANQHAHRFPQVDHISYFLRHHYHLLWLAT